MNKITVMGHVVSDAVEHESSKGKFHSFTLADNIRGDSVIWWRVTVFASHLQRVASLLRKGSAVVVIGSMDKPKMYTMQDGSNGINCSLIADSVSFSPFGKREDRSKPKAIHVQSHEKIADSVERLKNESEQDQELPF